MRPEPRVILFLITTADFGGTETFLYQLVTHLDRERFEPLVCSLCRPGRIGEQIVESGVPVISLDQAPAGRPDQLFSGSLRLRRLIAKRSVVLVQSLLYRANFLSVLATRFQRTRPVLVAGQRSLTALSGRGAEHAVRLVRGAFDCTVAVSGAVKEMLVEREGFDPQRIRVIGNGVDTDRFSPEAEGGLRAELGLGTERVIIGAVGRLSPEKGFDQLVRAFERLAAQQVDVDLLIAGEGPQRAALEALIGQLGLAGRVHLLGMRDDPERVYAALDVFALPSLEEGSPNSLIEAMASGRPSVATAVGGVEEIIDRKSVGIVVPPGSPEALADGLERLTCDPELRSRMAREARLRVEREFSLARMVEKHERLYDQLLSTPSSS